MWPPSCTLCPGSGHSPDFPKWISTTSGLRAVLLLFLPWLTELCSCPRLDLPGCYHRSPGENLPAPTSSAGGICPDACGTSLQHALHVPIPRSPSHPPSTGRVLLPISHQLITEQWPSLNSEADGFKFTLAASSQTRVPRNLEDQVWEPNPSPEHSKLARDTVSEQQRAFNLGGDTAPRVSTAAWLLQVFR